MTAVKEYDPLGTSKEKEPEELVHSQLPLERLTFAPSSGTPVAPE